jgi:AcrR family transcriptional regulator
MVASTKDISDKLAGCAFSLFSDRGIDRVRMDDIAASAGITKGSLYWHYRSTPQSIPLSMESHIPMP